MRVKRQSAELKRRIASAKAKLSVLHNECKKETAIDSGPSPKKRKVTKVFSDSDEQSDETFQMPIAENKKKNKLRLNLKYRNDPMYQEKAKKNVVFKYANDEQFRMNLRKRSIDNYNTNEAHKECVKRQSIDKYASNEQHSQNVRKRSIYKYATNEEHRRNLRQNIILKYETNEAYKSKVKATASVQYVQKKIKQGNLLNVLEEFTMSCQEAPDYICCVCHRMLFKHQVRKCIPDKYDQLLADQCITNTYLHECSDECSQPCNSATGPRGTYWICPTCDKYLTSKKMPPQAANNHLHLPDVPAELSDLNTLEEQLIALTIPFMKVVPLPKGKQPGIKGPVICVRSDPKKTTKVLPRPLSESQIVAIKLKRKLEYLGHSQFKLVHLKKIEQAFKKLKEINALYSDIELDPTWADSNDSELDNILDNHPIVVSNDDNEQNDTENITDEQNELGGLAHDTCLEPLDVRTDVMQELQNRIFSVAPGEGSKPHSLLNTPNDEMKAFPTLFPQGVNGLDEDRDFKISRAKYFNARLLSADLRFANNSGYIFYAQAQVELEKLLSGISIQSRKSTRSKDGNKITASMISNSDQFPRLMNSDQSFGHMDSLRGSPQYWKKVMNDLFAMIRTLGIPTWFCTFTAAELSRWSEFVEIIAKQSGREVDFNTLDFAEKCDILRSNPVTAVRLFYHRINKLMHLLKSPAHPLGGALIDYFIRYEFQARGTPHIHCLFWIEGAPKLGVDSDEAVTTFIDTNVSAQNVDETDELHEIIMQVQTHSKSHTRSCKTDTKPCRFNFPKPIMQQTTIVRPKSDPITDEEKQLAMSASPVTTVKSLAKACLENLSTILNEDVGTLTTQNVLNKAGFANFDEFVQALSLVTTKTTIYPKRDLNDVWTNPYPVAILGVWNANCDIQYITDVYSCVMYILSYISKSEHELGELLREAKLEMAKDPSCVDLKTQMKKLGFVYFENREVSVQEAVVRTTAMTLQESSRNTVFIATDENQVRFSKPLIQIMNEAKNDGDSEDIWVTCLYDKYKARPITAEFDRICQGNFASMYRSISNTEGQNAIAKANPNVYELQNELGYIMKRTRSPPAIIRYPKFSLTKEPEKHHMSLLKVYLPHRSESALKPDGFDSYADFYDIGAVRLTPSDDIQSVKSIVTENRAQHECISEELQETWQQIYHNGRLEDAWANIGPQSEQERIDSILQSVDDDEPLDITDVPDLGQDPLTNCNSLCSVELLGESMRSQLQTMNSKQRQIFYYVRQWCSDEQQNKQPNPFYLFVNGGAGVGKSHLIKCIYNEASKLLRNGESPLDTTVLLTAPTGTAAFNIGGYTLHSALKIPRKLSYRYEPLSEETLNTLILKLGNLKLLIIDEISMVDRKVLSFVHGRMRQIKQVSSSEKQSWFGNVSILAVGDFYQLPPVKAKSLMKPDCSQGFDIWHDLFTVVELTEIMRQKNDQSFAELLNTIRKQPRGVPLVTSYDLALKSRCNIEPVPVDALHIFAKNKGADIHNSEMLAKTCANIVDFHAVDYEKDSSGKHKKLDKPLKGASDDLPTLLKLATGARVMLTRNLDLPNGLVNGAFGTVISIDQLCDDGKNRVNVAFDKSRAVANTLPQIHVIKLHEETMSNSRSITRRQFPLKLAWACTIHKTQGMTTDKCVVDMSGIFATGQAYVALSRVTTIDGLYIRNYDASRIFSSAEVSTHLQNMITVPELTDKVTNDHLLSVVHHNVQGLLSKMPDIKNHAELLGDVLMFNETWLKAQYTDDSIHLEAYTLFRQDRLNNKGRGGVIIYVRENIAVKRLTTSVNEIEHVSLQITKRNETYIVVSIYRSPQQTLLPFTDALRRLLNFIETVPCSDVVIAGDFNENILAKSPCHIYDILTKQYGYVQHVHHATTCQGSLLDAVYTKTTKFVQSVVFQTYYSDHEAIRTEISNDMFQTLDHVSSNANIDKPKTRDHFSTTRSAVDSQTKHPRFQTSSSPKTESIPVESQLPLPQEIPSTSFTCATENIPVKSQLPIPSTSFATATPQNFKEQMQSNNLYLGIIPTGLHNLGNTCFVNSVLQVIFSLPSLQPLFENNQTFSRTLNQLKQKLYSSKRQSISPIGLFSLPQMHIWPKDQQQDAHEYFTWLLQELHIEHVVPPGAHALSFGGQPTTWLEYHTENESPVTDLIVAQYTITDTCEQCHTISTRYDYVRFANVYLQNTEVLVEESTHVNDISCTSCRFPQTVCTTEMTHCPPILFVLLMRFSGLEKNEMKMRLRRQILTKNNTQYQLKASVNHSGHSTNAGHYTAWVKIEPFVKWYKCDDRCVTHTAVPSLSNLPYILVYKRIDDF